MDTEEKPRVGTIVRPAAIFKFDPATKAMAFQYEDAMATPHGKSPKGDWLYRVRCQEGIWRAVQPGDKEGGLIIFVRDDPPPVFEVVSQNKKLLIRVVKVLANAAVGVLVVGV